MTQDLCITISMTTNCVTAKEYDLLMIFDYCITRTQFEILQVTNFSRSLLKQLKKKSNLHEL